MLDYLRRLVSGLEEPAANETDDEHTLRVVTAALLLETARADFADDPRERSAVESLVAERFGLAADATARLLEAAGTRVTESVSLFEFTHLLNSELDQSEKLTVVEMMWRVAHADGRIDKHEEHLVRRVADLLHVRHKDFVRLRLAVTETSA